MSVSYDNYICDLASSAIEYTKDEALFSPNNIRRAFFSPDIILFDLHCKMKTLNSQVNFKGLFGKRVDANFLSKSQMQGDKYKPAITVLTTKVTRLIEEVVICSEGTNGGSLDSRELEFSALLWGYNSHDKDMKSTIQKRYKRLVSFIVYNGTIVDFYKNTADYYFGKEAPFKLLKDSDWVKANCQIELFDNEEFYKECKGTPKTYVMDRTDGKLNIYLHSIANEFEKRRKADARKEFDDKLNSKISETMLEEVNKYRQIFRCYTRFQKMRKDNGVLKSKANLSGLKPSQLELNEVPALKDKKLPNSIIIKPKDKNKSTTDVYKENIDRLKVARSTLFIQLADFTFNVFSGYSDITKKMYIKSKDNSLKMMCPKSQQAKWESLVQSVGGNIKRASFKDTVYTLFEILCIMYLKDTDFREEDWSKCMN